MSHPHTPERPHDLPGNEAEAADQERRIDSDASLSSAAQQRGVSAIGGLGRKRAVDRLHED